MNNEEKLKDIAISSGGKRGQMKNWTGIKRGALKKSTKKKVGTKPTHYIT